MVIIPGHKYSIKMANVPHFLPVQYGAGCSISQFFNGEEVHYRRTRPNNGPRSVHQVTETAVLAEKPHMSNEPITPHSTKKRSN